MSDVAKTMRAISKAVGYGRVTVELPATGDSGFYARVFPSTNTAQDKARASLVAGGKASVSMDRVAAALEKAQNTQLAFGKGATPEDALTALLVQVKRK